MPRQDEYKTMQILSIKEDKAYLLHILQEKEKTLRLPATIEKIIDSFGIVTYIMKVH